MTLKIVIARFNHETNSFSPTPTPLSAFGVNGPAWGEQVYAEQKGAGSAMGAFIDIAESMGASMITPVAGEADPSAPMSQRTYLEVSQAILEAVANGCDGIMLDLHGAMLAEGADDGEGILLEQIRHLAPQVPICVSLDLHANITTKMIDNADIVVGFKTYPHVDIHATGVHAGELLRDSINGTYRPVTRWFQLPLLASTLSMDTSKGAMQRAIAAAIAAEGEPGVLAVSVFGGFPLADFKDAGASVVVVTDNDPELASRIAERIGHAMWADREDFVFRSKPLMKSLAEAKSLAEMPGQGPILLLDHSDNVMSGGTCDVMDVVVGVLEAGLINFAVGPIADPEAVAELIKAGVGSTHTVALGNKVPLQSQGITKHPVSLCGKVVAISDGMVKVLEGGFVSTLRMGRSVLFDLGPGQIIITERRAEPNALGVFSSLGIDPREKTYLVIKSRMYSRIAFMPIAKGLIECDSDSGGPTSANYALFPFKHIRRPIYPLDEDTKLPA